MLRFWNLIDYLSSFWWESSSVHQVMDLHRRLCDDEPLMSMALGPSSHLWTHKHAGLRGPSYPDMPQCCHLSATLWPSFLWPFWVQIWARTLAWKMPWMEEPGGLQSMGSLRVWHDWATSLSLFTFMHWRRQWQPTPVFLPGESQGWGILVGCHLWGCTESDMTEVT